VSEMITLPLGRVMRDGCQPEAASLRRIKRWWRQGFPAAFTRPGGLGRGLVDGVFMAVTRCLRSWAPASKRRPQR